MTRLVPEWQIRITNFGLGYVLMTLIGAIAATNTGNNGLYSVLAGLLAAMVISGIVSRLNIRAVTCAVESEGEVFAGSPAQIRVRLTNRSRFWTSEGVWFLHEAVAAPLLLDPLRPGEIREIDLAAVFPSRGVFSTADAGLMSRFPIGLFRKYRPALQVAPIAVYPRPERAAASPLMPERDRGGAGVSTRRGFDADIRTLREFQSGDDVRDLHWKQSARVQRWIVRERSSERSRSVVFELVNAVTDPYSVEERGRVERAISHLAGEALAILARGGDVGLAACGVWIPPRPGRAQRTALLEALARLPIHPADNAPAVPSPRPGEFRRSFAA